MKQFPHILATLGLGAVLTSATAQAAEIVRDEWGIPHVYADTEEGGFFAAGYATAQDRMFQMMLKRRQVQGRLSEILGPGPSSQFLESDRLMRTLDLTGRSRHELHGMESDNRLLLEAFARGVNTFLEEKPEELLPLFSRYGGHPEPWKAEDSLAVWNYWGFKFSPHWRSEVLARREWERNPGLVRPAPELDDEAAIVSEEEFKRSNPEAYRRLMKAGRKDPAKKTGAALFLPYLEAPKASHNWAVAPARSTTGAPLLMGKPQLTVDSPNKGHEVHIQAGRYNVRGLALPAGVPALLVGFNDSIAWAATALNSDTGDLFEERVNPENAGQYLWKGEWRDFRRRTATIRILDRPAETLEIRETIHGPVVNRFLEGVHEGEVYALKFTVLEAPTSSVGSILKLMRARDWGDFRAAASTYYGPGGHFVYADREGNIGYQSMVAIPARRQRNSLPREGWSGLQEWEMLPFEFLPSMLNPRANAISTANGLNVGSWHPFATSAGYGGGPRSTRLREIFAGDRKFSPREMLTEVHRDVVNAPARDIATLALAVARQQGVPREAVGKGLEKLAEWDARLITHATGFPIGNSLVNLLQSQMKADWILGYGGGWSGLTAMLRQAVRQYRRTGSPPTDPDRVRWLFETVEKAYLDLQTRQPDWDRSGLVHPLPYQDGGEFGSLAPEFDLESPPLQAFHTHTIWSQRGETYVQFVDLGQIDRSQALLPPGESEDPHSPHFKDQLSNWANGTLRAAPLSRTGVDRIRRSTTRLSVRGDSP